MLSILWPKNYCVIEFLNQSEKTLTGLAFRKTKKKIVNQSKQFVYVYICIYICIRAVGRIPVPY